MSIADSNNRGYTVIPAPRQGLDDLPIQLHLSKKCYSDTGVTCVNYLGVAIALCADKHDNCEQSKNRTRHQRTSPNVQLFNGYSIKNTDIKSEQSYPLSPNSVTTSEYNHKSTDIEHGQQGLSRRYSVSSRHNRNGGNDRRSSKLEEISELERMKRSLLSKSFLNLPQRDYCTKSSSNIAVKRSNSTKARRSQSAKNLLTTHRLIESGPCIETDIQHIGNGTNRAFTLPKDSITHEKYEHNNTDKQKHLVANKTESRPSDLKQCHSHSPVKSVSEGTFHSCSHSKSFINSVNNKNSTFHPLDRLFKRRSNKKRRRTNKFSLTLFLCGCSRRSLR